MGSCFVPLLISDQCVVDSLVTLKALSSFKRRAAMARPTGKFAVGFSSFSYLSAGYSIPGNGSVDPGKVWPRFFSTLWRKIITMSKFE